MKLEKTANLKLQYVNSNQTTTPHINNIRESDKISAKKLLKS